MLDKVSHGDFASRIGKTFTMEVPDASIEVTLVEAEAGQNPPEGQAARQPFVLLFRADPEVHIAAGAVTLKAEDGPALQGVNVSPVLAKDHADTPGTYIEVVFN